MIYTISTIPDKSATTISESNFIPGQYHSVIKRAAVVLKIQGLGHYKYGGQYSSLNTWWTSAGKSLTVVYADGTIFHGGFK